MQENTIALDYDPEEVFFFPFRLCTFVTNLSLPAPDKNGK